MINEKNITKIIDISMLDNIKKYIQVNLLMLSVDELIRLIELYNKMLDLCSQVGVDEYV